MSSEKKFYTTTAIPYVNAKPHIGFALELVQTDVLARSHHQRGEDVYFLTGADENSLKNVQAAEKAGLPVREFVDQNTQQFVDLAKTLNISNTSFVRTVDSQHHAGAQKLWLACQQEDIYKKTYRGLYCVGCEQFYTESELVDGKCPDHLTVPEIVEEENYFFKLSNYQKQLEELIASDTYKIVPESRKNEMLSFIRMGLQDFSISRSQARARNWGVPVPGDESQVMYVWFDALSNYITGLGYATDEQEFKTYWPCNTHVIGKGIIRFHAIYWPAMLLSAGVPLPKELFVHGYITIDGQKMSKSLGNVVDPAELVAKYGVEPVRQYFLRHISPFEDSDFTYAKFEEAYTADLANGLGNLVSRVSGLIEQNHVIIPVTQRLEQNAEIDNHVDAYQFDQAIGCIWDQIRAADVYISEHAPWTLAKEGKLAELAEVLTKVTNDIRRIAFLLEPFLPTTSATIAKQFAEERIHKIEPLFPRLT
jgi:methionyl-tRNA synthetase